MHQIRGKSGFAKAIPNSDLRTEGPVTRCNFSCNLQRNSTLKRCKLMTNV